MDSAEWQFEQGDTEVQKLSKCASAEIPEIDVRSERAIYYVDPHGAVAWANDAFARFAEANGAPELMRNVVGAHLLGSFSGVHRARWQGIYEQLSKGRMPGHVERFHCPSPTERREYLLRIVPVRVDDKVFLRHETTLLAEPATEPTFEGIERSEGGYSEKAFRFAIGVRPLGAESGDGAWARDLGDGRVALMIADAMGHGAAAVAALRDFFAIVDADPLEHPTQAIVRANERFLARPRAHAGESAFPHRAADGRGFDQSHDGRGQFRPSRVHLHAERPDRGCRRHPGGHHGGLRRLAGGQSGPGDAGLADRSVHGRHRGTVRPFGGDVRLEKGGARHCGHGGNAFGEQSFDGVPESRPVEGDALVKDDQTLLGFELRA